MYKYLKSLLRAEGVEPLSIKKKEILNNIYPYKRYSFGKKNKNKKFYVIKRNYNFNGLFSNLIFVIDHIKYAKQMIEKNIRVNNEFYIAPVYNELLEDGKTLIPFYVHKMWGIGTPEDLRYFLENYKK